MNLTKQEPAAQDFSTYCRQRFQHIMQTDPIFALNKPRMTALIAEEWKRLKQPAQTQQQPQLLRQLPSGFTPGQASRGFEGFVGDLCHQCGNTEKWLLPFDKLAETVFELWNTLPAELKRHYEPAPHPHNHLLQVKASLESQLAQVNQQLQQ